MKISKSSPMGDTFKAQTESGVQEGSPILEPFEDKKNDEEAEKPEESKIEQEQESQQDDKKDLVIIPPTTEVVEQVNNDTAENEDNKVDTPKSEVPRQEN